MDKIFNKPFAINGARVNIPENGTENERVSFDKGFTQPYEVEAPSVDNPSGQGFNILRPEMNEALYQLSNACNILAENIDKWIPLTNENLNNITQQGRYYQQNSEIGFISLNYPADKLGFLIVLRQNPNIQYITQIYKTMAENFVYMRYSRDGGNSWTAWDSLMLTSTANSTYRKIADSYSKSEVNNLLNQKSGLGVGQSWQNPSRSNNTQYTNNTGKPIMVAITFKLAGEHATGTCNFYVNDLIIASEYQSYIHIGRRTFSFIVPNGATYKVNCTGGFSIYLWAELR